MASNTKHKPIKGGKGQVHKLRTTASTKKKTDDPTPVLPTQRTPILHHSSQQRMDKLIRKMQQQSKVPPRSTQIPSEIHQKPVPAPPNTTDNSSTSSTPVPDTPQLKAPSPSNPQAPTADTSTSSKDMNQSSPISTKERHSTFHEARRTHKPT